jgi:uncharacterized protein YbjT (DUF2867 family)
MKILVTGATGNVGSAVLNQMHGSPVERYAGVRNIQVARSQLGDQYKFCILDFEKKQYPSIDFDAVFLLRPPQIADPKLFEEFLQRLNPNTKIVFLSVQGADKNSYLPHAKIEKLIEKLEFEHVFIRPSYFMENLTTTLWQELEENNRIYLPAADLRLDWIAVSDIAEVAKIALISDLSENHVEICSSSTHSFQEVVDQINQICSTDIVYESPSLIKYVFYNLKRQKSWSYILVMLLLHYLPRFKNQVRDKPCDTQRILHREPTSIEDFIQENCNKFRQIQPEKSA